jgi:hypothetical protein
MASIIHAHARGSQTPDHKRPINPLSIATRAHAKKLAGAAPEEAERIVARILSSTTGARRAYRNRQLDRFAANFASTLNSIRPS